MSSTALAPFARHEGAGGGAYLLGKQREWFSTRAPPGGPCYENVEMTARDFASLINLTDEKQ